MVSIAEALSGNPYPGRGILLGSLGGHALCAYFLTGRSENSRNRIFREEGDTLSILPFDEGKVSDPKLIFYTPIRVCNDNIVVTNGDHTETVCESLLAGHSFQYAMSTRCYEPDAPNYTPRIAGLLLPSGRYTLGIVKKEADSPDCRRKYWSYDPKEGVGAPDPHLSWRRGPAARVLRRAARARRAGHGAGDCKRALARAGRKQSRRALCAPDRSLQRQVHERNEKQTVGRLIIPKTGAHTKKSPDCSGDFVRIVCSPTIDWLS